VLARFFLQQLADFAVGTLLWVVRRNKLIFGSLFAAGLVFALALWHASLYQGVRRIMKNTTAIDWPCSGPVRITLRAFSSQCQPMSTASRMQ
jgi:hypothetical protein